jgi:hypothetical protein
MNQNHCWVTPLCRRDEQRTAKCDIAMVEAHLFLIIRRGRRNSRVPQGKRARAFAADNCARDNFVVAKISLMKKQAIAGRLEELVRLRAGFQRGPLTAF